MSMIELAFWGTVTVVALIMLFSRVVDYWTHKRDR